MNYNITEIKASHSREKDSDIYSVEYEIERMLSIALAISTYFELVCTEKSILLALEVHRTSHAVAS